MKRNIMIWITIVFLCLLTACSSSPAPKAEQKLTQVEAERTSTQQVEQPTAATQEQPTEEKTAEEQPTDQQQELAAPPQPQQPAPAATQVAQQPFLICIDPGHQQKADTSQEPIGPGATETKMKVTGGTQGVVTKKPEYVLVLEASNILGKLLEERGFQVVFTRTSHNVNISNKERADIANSKQADLFVRIHADGADDPNVKGFSALTPAANNPYTKGIYQESLQVSQHIVDAVKQDQGITVKGLSYRDDISGFNWSQVPTTLIEMGYMTNPAEDRNLSDTVYLTKLLTYVADGIVAYTKEKR